MDLGRTLRSGIKWGAIYFVLAAISIAFMFAMQGDREPPFPWYVPWAILAVAPFIGFVQGARTSATQQVWERTPRGVRVVGTLIVVVLLVAVNGVGIMLAKRQADTMDTLDCEPEPPRLVDRGTSQADLAAGPVFLLGESAYDETPVVATGPLHQLNATLDWEGPALSVTLSVRAGDTWFHGGTFDDVDSGDALQFELSNPEHDGFRFEVRGTVTEDVRVTIDWETVFQPGC